ncbi:hypothetical protein N1027_04845 [Herbiconiux sp. CPCC 205763]|uniref:Uncharacterized protein n=1 Tax=Herbiconiux aconitum TaxID=2970913 RepID=A0ABT2GMK3_9MICO|nr:hypothetical protein [Herbiconiux aconitum]MCS5717460.1 hypothetical protein [Herbiconiux aconitum]
MGDFSLIPSLIVFAVVVVALIVGLSFLRRRARRRIAPQIGHAPARVEVSDLIRSANIQLVQMDDAIRDADVELQFAIAEFGPETTHEFADAITTAKSRASEAFALKQRLDDSVPDSEQQQRDWSKRILSLSDSAHALVTAQSRAFERRRRQETTAPDSLRRVRDDIATGRSRLPAATASSDALAAAYAAEAVAPVVGRTDAARSAFDEAERLIDDATTSLEASPLTPVASQVQAAEAAVRRGSDLLDSIDRMRDSLRAALTSRDDAVAAARSLIVEASRLRDTIEDADAVARIVAASSALDDVARTAATRSPPHPTADLDALGTATSRLDETLAVARTAQQRLDSARSALVGAVRIADSHIRTASDFISARRGAVGTDARTRLAAAERELALAQVEADPVAALDGARRAATLATDADALARYDAGGSLDG